MARYLDGEHLRQLVIRRQTNPDDTANNESLGAALLLLADNVWHLWCRPGNPLARFADDAKSCGILYAVSRLDRFDEAIGTNAFAWLTGAIRFGVITHIRKECLYSSRTHPLDEADGELAQGSTPM